jgi:hypothetical protein
MPEPQQGTTRKVTAVHHYKGRTSVYREQPNLGTSEGLSLEDCTDEPSEAFSNAWATLIPLALQLLEIKDKSWIAKAVVSKLAIGEKDKRRNFVLTVIRKYEHGSATLNTPVRLEKFEEEKGAMYASDELTRAVNRVCELAMIYADGERTQRELPLEQPQAAGENGEQGGEPAGDPEGAPAAGDVERSLALV